MFNVFLDIANKLNNELNIVPLLYGSLGLEIRSGKNLYPDDIDILMPEKFNELRQKMEVEGFTLVDLREHVFKKII